MLTIVKPKQITEKLSRFSCLVKEDSYITVTEWENGEGYDINIDNRMFQLSHDELSAINFLTKYLDYYDN